MTATRTVALMALLLCAGCSKPTPKPAWVHPDYEHRKPIGAPMPLCVQNYDDGSFQYGPCPIQEKP